jgi:hypothetical protein
VSVQVFALAMIQLNPVGRGKGFSHEQGEHRNTLYFPRNLVNMREPAHDPRTQGSGLSLIYEG